MTIQIIRIVAYAARGVSALSLADAGGGDRNELLAVAEHDARALTRERLGWASSLAALIHAGLAMVRGNEDRARSMLERALTGFERADMSLHASAARRCLGSLIGGSEGRELVVASDAWLKAQTVRNPARMVSMLAPGFARSLRDSRSRP